MRMDSGDLSCDGSMACSPVLLCLNYMMKISRSILVNLVQLLSLCGRFDFPKISGPSLITVLHACLWLCDSNIEYLA
jgi:hypothetical protein